MKSVLILTYSFPPDNRIAALRPYKLAKTFLKMGWRVVVLRSDFTGAQTTAYKDLDGIEVIEYTPGALSRWFAEPGLADNSPIGRVVSTFRRLTRKLYLPEHTWALKRQVTSVAENLVASRKIDCLVTISFPFVFHQVGKHLKRKYPSLVWVADNRDLWSGNPYRGVQLMPKFLEGMIELKCLSVADLVTCAAESTSSLYRDKYGLQQVSTVFNGYEGSAEARGNANRTSSKSLTFVHTGSLYGGKREIGPLLEALGEVAGRLDRDIAVELYGESLASVSSIPVPARVTVNCHKRVSLADSYRVQAEADFLVVAMATDDFDRTYVPAKVFEYARIDRPVIALCHEHSDLFRIVSNFDLGVASFDPSKIAQFVEGYCEGRVTIRNGEDVRMLSADFQFSQLVDWVARSGRAG